MTQVANSRCENAGTGLVSALGLCPDFAGGLRIRLNPKLGLHLAIDRNVTGSMSKELMRDALIVYLVFVTHCLVRSGTFQIF